MGSCRAAWQWPLENFRQLSGLLAGQNISCLLTGSEEEGRKIHLEAEDWLSERNILNGFGKYNIKQLVGVLKNASAVVASGTGPLHLAAALGTPTIGLFPKYKGVNVKRWGAIGKNSINIEGCGGCTKSGWQLSYKEKNCSKIGDTCLCMMAISPERIFSILEKNCAIMQKRKIWRGE